MLQSVTSAVFAFFTRVSTPVLVVYLSIEFVFYLLFVFYIIPRVNQSTPPQPYRDHGRDRHLLLLRIVDRLIRTCRVKRRDLFQTIESFLTDWFHQIPQQDDKGEHGKQLLSQMPSLSQLSSLSASPENSDSDEPLSNDELGAGDMLLSSLNFPEEWYLKNGLRKDDMDDFFAWAFFAKPKESLIDWECDELKKIYYLLQKRIGLTFAPGRSKNFVPRSLSLENVDPMYRPLAVYVLVEMLKKMGDVVLLWYGFRKGLTQSGLVYWYRPARDGSKLNPLLFFHGIAPGSLSVYLPILFSGLATENRDVFLFENKTISCSIGFHALREEDTIQGVEEVLQTHQVDQDLCLCGHSFGTCQLTWLLHASSVRPRIRQLVLLDPVTIVLSEPDVVVNFLYSRQRKPPPPEATWSERWWIWLAHTKIRVVASSEVFIEYYLRRHFSWYNSELWLEDIPANVDVLVCLAEADEITNAHKIREEVDIHNLHVDSTKTSHVSVLQWKNKGHAYCLTSPVAWRDVKKHMSSSSFDQGSDSAAVKKCV